MRRSDVKSRGTNSTCLAYPNYYPARSTSVAFFFDSSWCLLYCATVADSLSIIRYSMRLFFIVKILFGIAYRKKKNWNIQSVREWKESATFQCWTMGVELHFFSSFCSCYLQSCFTSFFSWIFFFGSSFECEAPNRKCDINFVLLLFCCVCAC